MNKQQKIYITTLVLLTFIVIITLLNMPRNCPIHEPYRSVRKRNKIYILYTGGNLIHIPQKQERDPSGRDIEHDPNTQPGMIENALRNITEQKGRNKYLYNVQSLDPLLESSNITPRDWTNIAAHINSVYNTYDSFIIIHGTDTLSYTASALSFMLESLNKTVIVTGCIIGLQNMRNDARNNLITSLEIASKYNIPEVLVVFDNEILRACRSTKINSNIEKAFVSPNYPILGKAGMKIVMNNKELLIPPKESHLQFKPINWKNNKVVVIKLFPGIDAKYLYGLIKVNGIVLETYGIGDSPTNKDFLSAVADLINKGVFIVNVSQCLMNDITQSNYETSQELQQVGVISGGDMTTEAALTKMYFLLSNIDKPSYDLMNKLIRFNMRGEVSPGVEDQYLDTGAFQE